MTLSEFFKYLAYGELSQLYVGSGNQGEMPTEDFPKMISHINLGLTQIHTRLPIRHNEVFIVANGGEQRYRLHSDHLVDNAKSSQVKYLEHGATRFTDNVLKVEQLFNYQGEELPLNDENNKESAFTPRTDTIMFPEPLAETISVLYRADHPHFPLKAGIDTDAHIIDIPSVCMEPLLNYVTARVLGSRSSGEGVNQGSAYMMKFEQQLQQLELSGLWQKETPTNLRLEQNGWV